MCLDNFGSLYHCKDIIKSRKESFSHTIFASHTSVPLVIDLTKIYRFRVFTGLSGSNENGNLSELQI